LRTRTPSPITQKQMGKRSRNADSDYPYEECQLFARQAPLVRTLMSHIARCLRTGVPRSLYFEVRPRSAVRVDAPLFLVFGYLLGGWMIDLFEWHHLELIFYFEQRVV
jgi:hypothetical protein